MAQQRYQIPKQKIPHATFKQGSCTYKYCRINHSALSFAIRELTTYVEVPQVDKEVKDNYSWGVVAHWLIRRPVRRVSGSNSALAAT